MSQTKDEVTDTAVYRLRTLGLELILQLKEHIIADGINKVSCLDSQSPQNSPFPHL